MGDAIRIPETMKALAVDINSIRPWPRNYNNGDVDAISASLKKSGQFRAIVVRKGTGEILAGNHVYAAAMGLGWTEIAATFVEATDEQAKRIAIADNRTAQLAKPDEGLLAELLQELPDLEGTGYDERTFNELTDRVNDAATMIGSDGEKEYNPDAVIKYVVVFDSLDQQNHWFDFLKVIRRRYPGDDITIAGRLDRFLVDTLEN
jgi:hypothetical protein